MVRKRIKCRIISQRQKNSQKKTKRKKLSTKTEMNDQTKFARRDELFQKRISNDMGNKKGSDCSHDPIVTTPFVLSIRPAVSSVAESPCNRVIV